MSSKNLHIVSYHWNTPDLNKNHQMLYPFRWDSSYRHIDPLSPNESDSYTSQTHL